MLKGRLLVNRCCMCCCDGESVAHLLLHCPITHTLWIFMIQAFGIHWVGWGDCYLIGISGLGSIARIFGI